MNVEVRRVAARRTPTKIGAVPTGIGALLVAWIQLGPLGTLVTAAVTLGILILVPRVYPMIYRRRTQRTEPQSALVAEASLDGRAGTIRFFDDGLEWTGKGGERTEVGESAVSEALLSRVPLVHATRMALLLKDGTQLAATITASIDQVELALSSPHL